MTLLATELTESALLLWILNASGSHIVHWAWNKLSRALSDLGNSSEDSEMRGKSREAFLRAKKHMRNHVVIWFESETDRDMSCYLPRKIKGNKGNKHRDALKNVSLRTLKQKHAKRHINASTGTGCGGGPPAANCAGGGCAGIIWERRCCATAA